MRAERGRGARAVRRSERKKEVFAERGQACAGKANTRQSGFGPAAVFWREAGETAAYALLGLAARLGIGAVVGVFGRGVEFFSSFGAAHFTLYVWFLPLAGLFTVFMLRKWGKRGIGMAAAFRASRGEEKNFPLRNAVFQFAGTWSAHLFCASVGREGAAMQIGAAIGGGIGRTVRLHGADTILIVAGMAAGFSALFGTPVCALFFALEVTVVGGIRLRALTASAFASFAAYSASRLCGLAGEAFSVAVPQFALASLPALAAVGAACGLAGLVFCVLRKASGRFFRFAVKNSYVRVAAAGILLACLLYLTQGRYAGLGTNLVHAAFTGEKVYAFDWIVKILFTAVTLSVGFMGGEVTTFFAAGACLGASLGGMLGLDPAFAAALGYAAVFGAATNTLFAPVFLCVEVFGGAILPQAAVVCIVAYLFNFGHSVYNQRVREDIVWHVVRRIGVQRKELPLRGKLGAFPVLP